MGAFWGRRHVLEALPRLVYWLSQTPSFTSEASAHLNST